MSLYLFEGNAGPFSHPSWSLLANTTSGFELSDFELDGSGNLINTFAHRFGGAYVSSTNESRVVFQSQELSTSSTVAAHIACDGTEEGYRAFAVIDGNGTLTAIWIEKSGSYWARWNGLSIPTSGQLLEINLRIDTTLADPRVIAELYGDGSLLGTYAQTDTGLLSVTGSGFSISRTDAASPTLDAWNDYQPNIDPQLDTPLADLSIGSDATGVVYQSAPSFSDANSDALRFTVSPALPSGLELDENTGDISVTGPLAETPAADYVITADDSQGGNPATDTISVEITRPQMTASITQPAPYRVGETLTIELTNTLNATGKTAVIENVLFSDTTTSDIALTVVSQNDDQIVINVAALHRIVGAEPRYGDTLDIRIDDDTQSATIQVPFTERASHNESVTYGQVTQVQGLLADITGLQVGHYSMIQFVSGDADVLFNATNGAVSERDTDTLIERTVWTPDDFWGLTATNTLPASAAPANQAPTAVADSATTTENQYVDIPVLANDSDPENDTLSIASFTLPANGSLSDNGDGTLRYTPSNAYTGPDSFTYTVSDGNSNEDTQTVSITVNAAPPTNQDPQASQDSVSTQENTATSISPLLNDSDPDSDPLTLVSFTQGSNGAVTDNGDGTLQYTPNTDFVGQDSFSYTIEDGNGGQDTSSVIVTVQAQVPADTTRPTLSITGLPATVSTTDPIVVTFNFGESVAYFELADIAVTNGAASNFQALGGASYTALVTPDGLGDLIVSVSADAASDGSGNGNEAATTSAVWQLSSTDPSGNPVSGIDGTRVAEGITLDPNHVIQDLTLVRGVPVDLVAWLGLQVSDGFAPTITQADGSLALPVGVSISPELVALSMSDTILPAETYVFNIGSRRVS